MREDTFQFSRSQFFNKRRIVDNPLSVRGHRGKTRDGHEFQSQAQRSEKRLTQQELNTCARCALTEYIDHFHRERNHQGKGTSFCFPPHVDRSNAAAEELCNTKNDSVAYCDTTRPEQHEYWLGLLF